ncbi:MAG TPA: class I SAM-dependent methyltransferase [Candidatus Dormibacteraeota bacterium]
MGDGRLVDTLAEGGVITCPDCAGGRLGTDPTGRRCAGCGRVYPERHGVVDFLEYRDDAAAPSAPPSQEVIGAIIRGTGLEDSPRTRRAVEEIYARTARRTGSAQQSAEIGDMLDRFGVNGDATAASAPAPVWSRWERVRARLPGAAAGVGLSYERHYIEPRLPAGARIHRNVRVRNTGRRPWSPWGPGAFRLGSRWLRDGRPLAAGGDTTAVPIVIEPGRAITLPLRIDVPAQPGSYRLRVLPLAGPAARPVEGAALDVEVEAVTGLDAPAARVVTNERTLTYAEDHATGQSMLRDHVAARYGERPIRILEIGSGTHPQSPWVTNGEVVNLDISAPMLELGSLHYEQHAGRVAFLCCDALRPPLADASFDGVVMFATLHHFAEPEALLRRSRRLLVDGGFVAVMCEPVSEALDSPEVIRDLSKGIDEQVFSVDEYLAIFASAGLEPVQARHDPGSLKVILRAC